MFKNKKKSLKILDAQYHFRFLKQFTYQPISSWVHWKRANTLLYFGLPFTSQNKKCMRSPTDKPLHPCSSIEKILGNYFISNPKFNIKKTIKLLDFCLIFLAKHCKTSKCDEHHSDFTKENTWKSTKREWHPSDNIKRWETGPSSSCQVARQKSTTGSLTHLGGLLPLHFTVRWLNQQLGGLRHSGCGLSATRPVQTFRQWDISGQTPAVPYIQCGVRLGRVTTAHCARACVCARVCQVLTTLFFFLKCRYANTWWSESNQLKTDQNWELISHKKILLQMREFSIYTMDPWYENN